MIDNALRRAVAAGIDPVTAVAMATLSPAELFGFDHGHAPASERRGAVAPGKRADLLLWDDLTFAAPPAAVYAAGCLVAEAGRFVGAVAPEDARLRALADELRGSVKLPALSLEAFSYPFRPGEAVIDAIPGKAITGCARPRTEAGLRRIMLIERHGRGTAAQAAGADGDGRGTRPCGQAYRVRLGARIRYLTRRHRLDHRARFP